MTRCLRRTRLSIALAAASILVARPTAAGTGPLVEALKARQARIDTILSAHPGRLAGGPRQTLEEALASGIEFEAMARTALATWDTRPGSERAQYAVAFEKLIRRSLMRRVDIYRIEGVDYGAETVEGDHGTVKTVVRSTHATTEVVWEFVRTPRGWRVSDYSIDGVYTARNYRRQFARLLETKGWNGLVERINARAAEIGAEIEKEG